MKPKDNLDDHWDRPWRLRDYVLAVALLPAVLGTAIFLVLWLVFHMDPQIAGGAAIVLTILIWWWIERHPFGPKFRR